MLTIIYANLVITKKIKLSEVPGYIREKVKEKLIELGREDLTRES